MIDKTATNLASRFLGMCLLPGFVPIVRRLCEMQYRNIPKLDCKRVLGLQPKVQSKQFNTGTIYDNDPVQEPPWLQ